jgi:hypothetical protein
MRRCVSDERLLAISAGWGTIPERSHVRGCELCTVRLRHLNADLAIITQILREPPPRPHVTPARQSFRLGWAPAVAVGAAVLLAVWRLPLQSLLTPTPGPSARAQEEEIVELIANNVVPALFATREFGGGTLPKDVTNLSYVTAALDGGWPKGKCPRGRTRGCDDDPFALFFEEQED